MQSKLGVGLVIMRNPVNIASRVWVDAKTFGIEDNSVGVHILSYIANSFNAYAGIDTYHNLECIIVNAPHFESPEIRMLQVLDEQPLWHAIYLCVDCGSYWAQLIFQYAHEYCHHLINDSIHPGLIGLKWFEECLCHTASLFYLSTLSNHTLWHQWGYPHYAIALREYLDCRIQWSADIQREYHLRSGIYPWMDILVDNNYHRKHYDAVASILLPVFLRNPCLWGILGHIGQSVSWQDLGALLAHLRSTASSDYADSLAEMSTLLLGASVSSE